MYESKVAPYNYKRPKALVTSAMIARAREDIEKLGYATSLSRRFATIQDIPIENALYIHRSSFTQMDVFDELSSDQLVDPNKYKNAPKISLEDFLNSIPRITDLSILVENSHLANFVSLLTGEEPSMFKWDNTFSWAYTGGVTDSIKERVKRAGGNVDALVRVSLSWSNYDDLDLHVIEPSRERICYRNKHSRAGGFLDVDMNAGSGKTREPVENITWTKSMLKGSYQVIVNNYCKREDQFPGFTVQIESGGQTYEWSHQVNPRGGTDQEIINFKWDNGISFNGAAKSSINSKEKWGISTYKFYPVEGIVTSPNHWNNSVGNKHYIFVIKDMVNDEKVRGFFNEYLKPELVQQHKRMFEVLGSRINVAESSNQASGIGFSETKPANVTLKYMEDGKQKIVKLKIN